MTTTQTQFWESPVGNIVFSALNRRVPKGVNGSKKFNALKKELGRYPSDEEAENAGITLVYSVRLEFDGNTAEGKDWKAKVSALNENIVGRTSATQPGNFTVQATSKFPVIVTDAEGTSLEGSAIPSLSGGKAKMLVTPYQGNALGGSINLVAVNIKEAVVWDSSTKEDRQTAKEEAIKRMLG